MKKEGKKIKLVLPSNLNCFRQSFEPTSLISPFSGIEIKLSSTSFFSHGTEEYDQVPFSPPFDKLYRLNSFRLSLLDFPIYHPLDCSQEISDFFTYVQEQYAPKVSIAFLLLFHQCQIQAQYNLSACDFQIVL